MRPHTALTLPTASIRRDTCCRIPSRLGRHRSAHAHVTRADRPRLGAGEATRGQATTEYALVLLAAALVGPARRRLGDGGRRRGEGRPSVRPGHRLGHRQGVTAGDDARHDGSPACDAGRPGRGRAGPRAAGGGRAAARDAPGGARRPRPVGRRAGGTGGRPGRRRLGRPCGGRPAGCRAGHVAAARCSGDRAGGRRPSP